MSGLDPYRRIKGESVTQRTIRINQELAARNKGKPSIDINPWVQDDNDPRWVAGTKDVIADVGDWLAAPVKAAAKFGNDYINPFTNQEFVKDVVNNIHQDLAYLGESKADVKKKQAAAAKAKPAQVFNTSQPAAGYSPSTADVVYGHGAYGKPSVPLSQLSMGAVQNFQKNTLIPNTRGKIGAGPDKGTGAVGTYQIVHSTLAAYGPKVFGPGWQSMPFSAANQEKLARAIYEDNKHGNLKSTWQGLPNNKPGAYSNVPWEAVRDKIIAVESAGGGGGGGGIPGIMNPADANFGQEAMQYLDQAAAAAKQPVTMAFDMPPPPEFPDAIMPAPTDFTKVNERLEAMKPVELAERDKIQIRREGFFRGLSEGLSRVVGAQGAGDALLGIGAAMLRGRSTGDSDVRARMDEFDDKMAKYNMLLLTNDTIQAQTIRQEAQYSASELNRHAVSKHSQAMQDYAANNGMTITADAFITRKTDKDGKMTVVRTPIGPVIDSLFAQKKAELSLSQDQNAFQGNAILAQANNGFATAVAAQALQQGGQAAPEGAVLGAAVQAYGVVSSGAGANVLGAETWGSWETAAKKLATQAGHMPGTEGFADFVNKYLTSELTRAYGMEKPNAKGKYPLREAIASYGDIGVQVNDAERYFGRKETTKTNAKGQTSASTAF